MSETRKGGLLSLPFYACETSQGRLPERRHHFPGEQFHRAHKFLTSKVAEGEQAVEVVDAAVLHGTRYLVGYCLRRPDDEGFLPDLLIKVAETL